MHLCLAVEEDSSCDADPLFQQLSQHYSKVKIFLFFVAQRAAKTIRELKAVGVKTYTTLLRGWVCAHL